MDPSKTTPPLSEVVSTVSHVVSKEMVPSEIVHAELNLEKWSIWEPSSTRKALRPRIFERERILPDGSRVTAKVEIGFTQHGSLSTRDQKIYYVLLKLWDDAGRPATPVVFSLQKIARVLGEEWGRHTHRSITQSLLQLRGVLFVWEDSYFDPNSGEHLERLDTFNILSELSIARRTKKLHPTTEACQFQFHRQLLASLHAHHTTPLFLDTVLSFRSEIAQLLYPRLDLLLADKKHYERRTRELFEDLGLEGETYRHRSARKRVLERALLELQGVPLTTGRIVAATVEPTRDNLDFKLVVHKGPLRKASTAGKRIKSPTLAAPAAAAPAVGAAQTPPSEDVHTTDVHTIPPETGPAKMVTTVLAQTMAAPLSKAKQESPENAAEALVRHFHQRFHGAALRGVLNPKELAQAVRLVQTHELSKAKALVDFALAEAQKTRYAPASLNGILQYEGRFEALCNAQETMAEARWEQQGQQRRAHEAQEQRQREMMSTLMEMVGLIKTTAPEAFTAFVSHIESERAQFLETPIARKAKPETQELLSREYERPAKRLEMFLGFFQAGGKGAALLTFDSEDQEVSQWLRTHGEILLLLLRSGKAQVDGAEWLQLMAGPSTD
jgi:hypothetical protein